MFIAFALDIWYIVFEYVLVCYKSSWGG